MQRQYRPRLRSRPAILSHRRRAPRAFVGLWRLRLLCALVVAASWGAAAPSESADESAGEIVVLVNPANDIASVTALDLGRIYRLSRQHWANGAPIALYLPPPSSDAADVLASRVLNVGSEDHILAFYLRAVFRQRITVIPETLLGTQAAVARVAANPRAIALISLSGQAPPSVRVLPVDGL